MIPKICPLCLRTMQRSIRRLAPGRSIICWTCERCIYCEMD